MNRYFDNGSTSFPKPPQVAEAMANYLGHVGGTYGRAAYGKAFEASQMVEACRDKLAELFGAPNAEHLFFCANATGAINTILKGMPLQGKQVLVSPLEHNAVMRTLEHLKQFGTEAITLPAHADGRIDTERLQDVPLRRVGLVVVNHQSNVSGVVQPIADIKAWCGKVPLLVDASQSAGQNELKISDWGVDFLAFTGHKGLLGPTGTGGFYAHNPDLVSPLLHGGTGSNSDRFDMPLTYPDRFEAGTPNMAGIAGLLAALTHIPPMMAAREEFLQMIGQLSELKGIRILRSHEPKRQGLLFSFSHATLSPSTIAERLYRLHGIEVRSGLHCAPAAHRFYDTFPHGTVRIAASPYHTANDYRFLVEAVREVCGM